MATNNEIVLLIGGADDQSGLSVADTHIYSIGQNTWVKGPNLNIARTLASACCLNGYTYAFCGAKDDSRTFYNSIERLDNDTRQVW